MKAGVKKKLIDKLGPTASDKHCTTIQIKYMLQEINQSKALQSMMSWDRILFDHECPSIGRKITDSIL